MLSTPENKCPLCGFALDALEVVSDDSTPYAHAETRSYWKMLWWILLAGSYRLSHVARMRRSRSSLRFAWLGVIMLAVASVLIALPGPGWKHIEDRGASYSQGYPQPEGGGWKLVGKASRPPGLPTGEPALVRLWWNPGLWAISLAANFAAVLLLGWLLIWWVTVRSNRALLADYRGKQRFTAAIDYCTAHVPILLLAALFEGSSVLHMLGRVGQWSLRWPLLVHTVPAYLISGLGLFLLWFWLLRVAHTAPPATSAGISRYFGLWAPLAAVLIFGGWAVGRHYGIPHLAAELHMNFDQ